MAFVQIVLTFPFAAYKINDGLVYRLALLGTVPARCYFFCAKPACQCAFRNMELLCQRPHMCRRTDRILRELKHLSD